MPKKPREFISVREAAEILDCSIYTVYRMIRAGDLDYRDVGLASTPRFAVARDQVADIAARREEVHIA